MERERVLCSCNFTVSFSVSSKEVNFIIFYLDGLCQRAVVVDRIAVRLDGDLLFHASLHYAVTLRLILK